MDFEQGLDLLSGSPKAGVDQEEDVDIKEEDDDDDDDFDPSKRKKRQKVPNLIYLMIQGVSLSLLSPDPFLTRVLPSLSPRHWGGIIKRVASHGAHLGSRRCLRKRRRELSWVRQPLSAS